MNYVGCKQLEFQLLDVLKTLLIVVQNANVMMQVTLNQHLIYFQIQLEIVNAFNKITTIGGLPPEQLVSVETLILIIEKRQVALVIVLTTWCLV